MRNDLGLVPLRNFAQVDEHLFRCAQPHHGYEYKWLKDVLDIDIIVNLRAEKQMDMVIGSNFGIGVYNIDVKDHNAPNDQNIKDFCKILNDNPEKNILIHCEHGHGRTSTFNVIARINQGWTLEDALREEEDRFHFSFSHPVQKKFLMDYYTTSYESQTV